LTWDCDWESVALLIAITPEVEQKVGILVQVHPTGENLATQPQTRFALGIGVIQEVQSRTQDNYIQLKRFQGNPRECFNIQVAFGEARVTENFVI